MKTNTGKAPHILIVEDEPELREAMMSYLIMEGFTVDGAGTLSAARAQLAQALPDILILDLGLPDGDSLNLLDQPRLAEKGLIITTARSRVEDRLMGVKRGADAYLVKPIELEELALVIHNLYRRLQGKPQSSEQSWVLNTLNWTLKAPNGKFVQLTRSEVLVLSELASTVGHALDRETLIGCLGQKPENYDWRRMEILIRRLRNKCESLLDCSLPLRTVHGFGYALTEAVQVQQDGATV